MITNMDQVSRLHGEKTSDSQKCSRLENVYSPCRGKIEKVFVQESSYIYEWEKLVTIRTYDGATEEVALGVSGNVTSVEVEPGEEVDVNTVLCKVEDDLQITGCD